MARIVKLKIDVTKIDKARLYKGQKGTYLDAVVFLEDEPDKYGNNGMITQSITKAEKDQGIRGAILGNAKIFQSANNQPQNQAEPTSKDDDDLPW